MGGLQVQSGRSMRKFILSLCALLLIAGDVLAVKRPNFVFLVSEDNSIHYLKLYGYGASTPNIAALAKDGLTFNHAFSNSPVCSVARSTLATSLLAPRAGFQYHRCLLYTSPSPRDKRQSRMPSSA